MQYEQEEPIIDLQRVGKIVQRRWKSWALLGSGLFVAGFAGGLYVVPQTYTSTVSISVQRPGASGSPLGGLMGLNSGQKNYGGVVKSLRMAEEVEAQVGLRQLYHLDSTDEATRQLSKSVILDDNAAEGLLYITVSLPAPPRMARHAEAVRKGAWQASAQAANAYAEALRRYTVETDNDKDAVMLRMSENQIKEARTSYDNAIDRLQAFVSTHHNGIAAAQSLASGDDKMAGAASGDSASGGSELGGLYRERAQLEQDIQMREATRAARTAMLDNQLHSLTTLPGEDPLLAGARSEERKAEEELQSLRIQFEAEHPQVVAAQERLRLAQARVRKEAEGLKNGLTSDRALNLAELSGLRSRLDKVHTQIAQAESQAHQGREQTAQLEKLRNEALLRLEVLKTTSTQVATLRVQTASSQSRILVIDRARPALFSQPGLILMSLFSLFASLAVLLFWLIGEYAFGKRDTTFIVTPLVRTSSGSATAVVSYTTDVNGAGDPADDATREPMMILSDIDAEGTNG